MLNNDKNKNDDNKKFSMQIKRALLLRMRLRELAGIINENFSEEELQFLNSKFQNTHLELQEVVEELNEAFPSPKDDGLRPSKFGLGFETLGSPLVSIKRGYLRPQKTIIIAPQANERVIAFLAIAGGRDKLARETHGYGYHYHYVLSDGRRSDTLLTFRPVTKKDSAGIDWSILCWERHADRNGSKVKAKAGQWGVKKCESVYEACSNDLSKFNLCDFKRPDSTAKDLHPII